MSEAKQGGAGVFAKIVQKRISRAQEKVLQKLGRTIETKDEMFEQCAYNFSRQQNEGNRLYKDLKAVFGAVKAMHESSRKLSETLHVIYRPEWDGYNDLRAIVENDDLLWNDYEEKLSGQVVRTMENYMAQFPEMKERIAKRGRKMVDYDSARHHLETLQNAKKKDEAKITKAEEEFNKAQMVFEDLNKELREDLPVLYSSRIGCYVNIFQNISNLRDVFFKEMSKLNHELYDVMSKLEKQHSNKVFVIKGLKSNRKSLVISSPISSTSSFFMASVDPAVNNPVNKADSIDQTYDISSVSSHSSETQDSNSMDGTSWKSSQEVTVDLAQGSPDDLSQRPSDKPVLKISEEFKQEDTLDTIEKPSMASVEMDAIQMDPEDSKESDLEGQTKTNSGDTTQGGPEDVVKGDSGSTTAEGIDQITERSSGVTEQEESKESSHGKSGDAMQTRSDNTTPYKEKDPKDTAQLDTCEIMQCDSDDTTKGNSSMETTGGSREVIQCGAVDMTQVNTRHAEEEDLLHPTWKEPGGMQQGQLVNMAYLDDSEFRLHEAIKTMAMEPTTVQILETSKNTSEGISEDLENTNVPEANMCLETTNNTTAGPLSRAAESRCLCVCDEGDLNQNAVSSLQTQIDSDISSMRQKTNQSNDLDTAGSNPPGPSSEEEGSCISATTDKDQEAQMETGADKDQSTSSQHEELLEGTKNEDYQEHLSLTEKKPT